MAGLSLQEDLFSVSAAVKACFHKSALRPSLFLSPHAHMDDDVYAAAALCEAAQRCARNFAGSLSRILHAERTLQGKSRESLEPGIIPQVSPLTQ